MRLRGVPSLCILGTPYNWAACLNTAELSISLRFTECVLYELWHWTLWICPGAPQWKRALAYSVNNRHIPSRHVYDSVYLSANTAQIAALLHTQAPEIHLQLMNVVRVLRLWPLCIGLCYCISIWGTSRSLPFWAGKDAPHLYKCFEKRKTEMFPYSNRAAKALAWWCWRLASYPGRCGGGQPDAAKITGNNRRLVRMREQSIPGRLSGVREVHILSNYFNVIFL